MQKGVLIYQFNGLQDGQLANSHFSLFTFVIFYRKTRTLKIYIIFGCTRFWFLIAFLGAGAEMLKELFRAHERLAEATIWLRLELCFVCSEIDTTNRNRMYGSESVWRVKTTFIWVYLSVGFFFCIGVIYVVRLAKILFGGKCQCQIMRRGVFSLPACIYARWASPLFVFGCAQRTPWSLCWIELYIVKSIGFAVHQSFRGS